MRRSAWTLGAALTAVLSLGVAACGGGGSGGGTDKSKTPAKSNTGAAPGTGKRGGTLTILSVGDITHTDCGQSYYQVDYEFCYATQRPLYSYKPDDGVHMVPDLASAAPEVAADGKTVTVKIRTGVKFSAPVNRDVTSKDVKYAIERGFFETVANGYAGGYYGDIVGAKLGVKPGTAISGITTPDDQTLVIKLSKPTGGVLAAGALALPLTAPVPEEYAAKFDAKTPTTYGENQVATGPYMIQQNAAGEAIGYQAGKSIHLVRNPNWDKATDYKPAYLDEIMDLQGNDDTSVASRRILTGQGFVSGDWSPPPAILKDATTKYKSQLAIIPGATDRYVSMNTTIKPFDNVNVRRAVVAAFDRNALRLARGGATVGDIATHFLAPGIAGFEEAGGLKGPGDDFMNATGEPNMALAASYMKKAGYPSGKYTGTESILAVGSNEGTAPNVAEIAKENFEKLGFKITLRLVSTPTMFTKFCGSPAAKVAICPNIAWGKDFSDGQTMLDLTFNGKNIIPQQNSNFPELNDPAVNAEMDKAEQVSDPAQRATAWAKADRDITALAPAVPFLWDKLPLIESANVNGVVSQFNTEWDLSWTSLK
jgi:peptide/nickel transport system substrate-binding protein